jgi:prolyl oligopeptidase
VRDLLDRGDGTSRILVDPHALTGDTTAALDWYEPSEDGRLVAFGTSLGGDERSTLRIVDAGTGDLLPDTIPFTRAASVAWAADGDGFAYTRWPDPAVVGPEAANYDRTVWWHDLGTDPSDDTLVFDDLPDKAAWAMVELSRDERWLLVQLSLGWSRVDVHLIDRSTGARATVIAGEDTVSYFTLVDDLLVGHTTLDAPRGRVVAAPLADPDPRLWRTIVPESDDVIEGVAVTAGSLLVASTRGALGRLRRVPRTALAGTEPADPGEIAEIAFTSWARPAELWRWTAAGPGAGDLVPWSGLPSPVDPTRYTVTAERYASTDGAMVTLFTLRRSDVEPGPDTPTLLTGYGGFAVTMSPAYSPVGVAVADDDGVYAVACIRGGAEEGEDWHRAGMRGNRQQVFDDFAEAARWLAAQGRTSPGRLAIQGGSNGGLLVATTLVQHPDVCRAVVCAVPVVDMLRYPRFLIGRFWTPEYGDPDVPEEFAWLWAYSPYHRLAPGRCYPATLVLTGEEDSRVDPAHARKFGAALAAATTCGDERPVLVRIEPRAGHGQGKPTSKQAEEAADAHAFLRWQVGLTAPR